jgi:flagellar protein FlgJ
MLAAALTANDSLAVDVSGAQALRASAAVGDKAGLRKAAQQFESLMIGMMLKNMRETKFSDEDDPMTSGEGTKLYRDLLDQQWATQLAKGRGLGFADMIVNSMEKYAAPTPASTTGPDAAKAKSADAVPVALPVARPVPVAVPLALPATHPEGAAQLPGNGSNTATNNATPATAADRKRSFLDSLRPHAEAAAAATGVPADFILAHAALESGWGAREITAADGSASHNLFGIKAGGNWQGAAVETQTTEYRQGVPMKLTQRFRAYADYSAGFSDYASLLKSRYGAALEGADAGSFAAGLATGGYASDPAYAGKLKSVIASVAMAGG